LKGVQEKKENSLAKEGGDGGTERRKKDSNFHNVKPKKQAEKRKALKDMGDGKTGRRGGND